MRWIFTIVLALLSIGVWAEDDCVIIKDGAEADIGYRESVIGYRL